jgi:hypothetical protein
VGNDPAELILWFFGILAFFVAVYLVMSAPQEMTTSRSRAQHADGS